MSNMLLIMETWRKHVLQERVFGAQAIVFHGSDLRPGQMFEILSSNNFKPGSGAYYGKGMYSVYEEDKTFKTFTGFYGKYVYKLKVNLYGFIIFDPDIAEKVYGQPYTPWKQMEIVGYKDAIEEMKQKYDLMNKMSKNYTWYRTFGFPKEADEEFWDWYGSAGAGSAEEFMAPMKREEPKQEDSIFKNIKNFFGIGKKVESPDKETSVFTSKGAKIVSDILSKHVKGIVFTGEGDGKVAVIYDAAAVIPIAWSHALSTIEAGQSHDKDITWHSFREQPYEKEKLKQAAARSAMGEFTPGRYVKRKKQTTDIKY